MKITDKIMYQASLDKNRDFEGVFWMGVKTTGIFCRPTCTARKPKIENVEFFENTMQALEKGYRPCKICRPLENPNETPESIQNLLDELETNPEIKLKDEDLLDRNLEPNAVRRWFIKNHGMTFHAFQRALKLNTAFKKIQQGENVLEVALESGYDSLSGFAEGFKNNFGFSPNKSKKHHVLDVKRIETPIGTMIACADDKGICMLEFSDRKSLEKELQEIAKAHNANVVQGENLHFKTLEKELSEYFAGKRKNFTVPISAVGTDFQKKVWEILRSIPYANTRTYLEQAQILGNPKATRAVANANGLNKISIIIPCHRVIGSNGKLTGYGGGVWRKQFLLDLERKNS